MLSPAAQQRLWDTLFTPPPEGEPMDVYAVLDGASVRMLPDFLEDEGAQHAPLLPTSDDPVERTRAAYLVRLERHSRIEDWLGNEGWGKNWGCFVLCTPGTAFDDLINHFRELTQVRLPDGRIVFFRFYDPRVWRPFLPTCDAVQLKQLFGVPAIYAVENDTSVIIDRVKNGMLNRSIIQLDEFAATKSLPGVTAPSSPS